MSSEAPRDLLSRPLRTVRLSVTDRCNLRCAYCMPEDEYAWLARDDLLSFEELSRVARVFAGLGATKLKLTGGEPLMRRDLSRLVELLRAAAPALALSLTTNAVLLAEHAVALRAAGLGQVTVSLDTLNRERYRELTRRDALDDALVGIAAARQAGFARMKLNTVVVRGVNDDELSALLAYGREHGIEVRFIEYMDVGGATHWSREHVVGRDEILGRVTAAHGPVTVIDAEHAAPARRYVLADGTSFGIIASTTAPFCRACDRARLTADGTLYLCLYAARGVELRALLRGGATDEELTSAIRSAWAGREDRGAEVRLNFARRGPAFARPELERDLHLEMHTRGG